MTTTLPTRPLGRTGLPVSVLGFGAAPLGDLYGLLDDRLAVDAITTGADLGVTLVDTAPLYGHGLSEHRVGTAVRRIGRDRVTLCTKVGRWMDVHGGRGNGSGFVGGQPHAARVDYSYDGTLRALEQSLIRLGTDHLEIVLIHDVDVWTHGKDAIEARFGEAMNGAYKALERLRSEGAVKAIGVGVNEADMCARFARAGDFDAMLLAGRYSLLEQPGLEEFMPLALQKGIGILLGGVFNSGILATGAVPGAKYNYQDAPEPILAKVRRIEAVCARHGVALPHAAMQFALGHPAVASLVLGATTPDEVRRNVEGLQAPIPSTLWSDLKADGLLAADAPVPAA